MDQFISSVLGAILFAAFAIGLAESIGDVAFFVIVFLVVGMMVFDVRDLYREVVQKKD